MEINTSHACKQSVAEPLRIALTSSGSIYHIWHSLTHWFISALTPLSHQSHADVEYCLHFSLQGKTLFVNVCQLCGGDGATEEGKEHENCLSFKLGVWGQY